MPILARAGAAAAKGFGMLGKIAAAVDEYFEYVTLLLHGNGTNGAQNNTFLDSSTNNFTITRNGNTTQGTFTPYGSNWSNYFDGSGDYFSIADNAAFDIGTGDFSLEAWVYMPSVSGVQGIASNKSSQTSGGFGFYINSATPNAQVFTAGTENADTVTGPNITANQWFHIAAVRTSGTFRLYVNGVGGTSISSSRNGDNTSAFQIGLYEGSLYPFTGYISNLRLIKGSGPYNAANSTITVPTSPLTAITNTSLLTCQSNRFRDASSNNLSLTRNGDVSVQRFSPFAPTAPYAAGTIGGSGYFDGSGDYLTVPSNTAFAFNGAYTVEFWLFPLVQYGSSSVVGFVNETTTGGFVCYIDSSSRGITIGTRGGSNQITTGAYPTANTWNHIVVCRDSSNNTSVYLNGARIGTASLSTSYTSSGGTVEIGTLATTTYPFTGYMSNLRIVKGTAVYDPTQTTITVPTAPLTAITNTSLLLNFTNGGIIDNAMMNDLETVGNAQISTSVSKFGGGSLAFDGNGDWLQIPNSQNFNFGSGNFTVEGWVYCTNTSPRQDIFTTPANGSGFNGLSFGVYNGNFEITACWSSGSWQILFATAGTVNANTWYHFAVVRNGGTLTVYVNGTSTYSNTTLSTNSLVFGTDPATISYGRINQSDARYLYGYIDDLRITKGYARYTANFTAPTAPFPDQ